MPDDIVTTLRTMVQFTNAVAGDVCWRAADEIERVQAERDNWRKAAIEISSWEKPDNPEEWAQMFYDKQVSGEEW